MVKNTQIFLSVVIALAVALRSYTLFFFDGVMIAGITYALAVGYLGLVYLVNFELINRRIKKGPRHHHRSKGPQKKTATRV